MYGWTDGSLPLFLGNIGIKASLALSCCSFLFLGDIFLALSLVPFVVAVVPLLLPLKCLIRFRGLITSVLRAMGLGLLWSFRNNPQALHKTWPPSSLLHSGVVLVLQLLQIGALMLPPPIFSESSSWLLLSLSELGLLRLFGLLLLIAFESVLDSEFDILIEV